jgi:uncharacterized membrane protein
MSPEEKKSPRHGVSSRAAIGKHPLHPVLVDFPIAFLIAALLTDLLYWRTGTAQWADFSFYLTLAGWLGGLLAVATGLIDFLTIERARTLSAGWLHFLAADLAIFISTFNLVARLPDHQGAVLPAGLAYSGVVALLLVIAGGLGGQLVFHRWIGVYGLEQGQAEEEKEGDG